MTEKNYKMLFSLIFMDITKFPTTLYFCTIIWSFLLCLHEVLNTDYATGAATLQMIVTN